MRYPDPWRNQLRDVLRSSQTQNRLDALRALARSAKVGELPQASLDLLGRGLLEAGDPQTAESILRPAQRRYPGDGWLNYDLARCLEKLARRGEAIRYYTTARSIRPEFAHKLAHVLEDNGESDEAIEVFGELRDSSAAERIIAFVSAEYSKPEDVVRRLIPSWMVQLDR